MTRLQCLLIALGITTTPILAAASAVSTFDPANPNRGLHVGMGSYLPLSDGDSQFSGHFTYDNDDVLGSGDGFYFHLNPDYTHITMTDRGYAPYSGYTIVNLFSHITDQTRVEHSGGEKIRDEEYDIRSYEAEIGRGMFFAPHIRGELAFAIGNQDYSGTTAQAPPEDDDDENGDAEADAEGFIAPADNNTYHLRARLIAGGLSEDRHYQPKTSHMALMELEYTIRDKSESWGPADDLYGAPGSSSTKLTLLMRGYHNYPQTTLGYRFQMGVSSGLDRDSKYRIGGGLTHDENAPSLPGWYQDEIAASHYALGGMSASRKLFPFVGSHVVGFGRANLLYFSNSTSDGTTHSSDFVTGFSLGASTPAFLAGRIVGQLDYSPDADHDGMGVLVQYEKKW
ncbi:hypothetical protein [Desulfurispira natronophila]|uniref:Bacterial surface antigen (D15) domain-containing protein n=1 Tax=Desulfurispira natronophila TaxID=682562 RepID=A0A7W7Y544_9BACT|nr:hypothetical protein [Desulfurispira natronophila]MBB5022268.1 hypothetical protein [Desulfurispira natronophila]